MPTFLDFDSVVEGTVYTVRSMQYLYGSAGYFYTIEISDPDNIIYYMNVREGTFLGNIYDKLEAIRRSPEKKRFIFTKSLVAVSSDFSTPVIIVEGENGVVNLDP